MILGVLPVLLYLSMRLITAPEVPPLRVAHENVVDFGEHISRNRCTASVPVVNVSRRDVWLESVGHY